MTNAKFVFILAVIYLPKAKYKQERGAPIKNASLEITKEFYLAFNKRIKTVNLLTSK